MPVENNGLVTIPPNITVDQPEAPFTVERDMSTESTGVHEVEVGDHVVEVDWHDQTPTGAFPQGEGETVELDIYKRDAGMKDAQTKVVSPPAEDKASSTDGAETK
jgi:hypothetical protein